MSPQQAMMDQPPVPMEMGEMDQGQPPVAPVPEVVVFPEARFHQILNDIADKYVDQKIDPEKSRVYSNARRNHYFYHGLQWLVPKSSQDGRQVDWKPLGNGSNQMGPTSQEAKQITNAWVVNDFRGDVKKFIAVLGKAPNVIARESWKGDETGEKRARIANVAVAYLYSQWLVDEINRQIVKSVALYGTTFIHNFWLSDRNRYGVTKEPVIEMVDQKMGEDQWECTRCGAMSPGGIGDHLTCPQCQAPMGMESFREAPMEKVAKVTGEKDYANGCPQIVVASVSEVSTPFYVKDLKDSNCPWLRFQYELDSVQIVELHPNKGLEELLNSENEKTGDIEGEQLRAQKTSPDGMTQQNRTDQWTYAQYWLTPAMYNYVYKMGIEAQEREQFLKYVRENFKRGLHFTRVKGKNVVFVEEASLSEDWVAIKPEPSEYLYCDPHFQDYIQGAIMMNTAWNMEVELRLQSVPFTMFNQNKVDDSLFGRRLLPGEFIPVDTDGNMSDLFFKGTAADPKPDSFNYITTLRSVFREIVGIMPAIFGGEDISGQTAEEARRKLNQALQVLAIVWSGLRSGWSQIATNGVTKLAKYSNEMIYTSLGNAESATGKKVEGLRELLEGGYYFECDQAIPMAWTQLKDFIQSLFTQAPDYADAMGARKPANLSKIAEGIGMTGWEIPGIKERQRILGQIERLKQEVPVIDQFTGMPTASIPIDTFTFDPNFVVEVVRDWLMEPEAADMEGQPGYQNILLWGQGYLASIPPVGPDGQPLPPDPNAPPPGQPIPPSLPAPMVPNPEMIQEAPDAPMDFIASLDGNPGASISPTDMQ